MAFADLHSQTQLTVSSIFTRCYYRALRQGSTLLPASAAYQCLSDRTKYDESCIHAIGAPSRVNGSQLL